MSQKTYENGSRNKKCRLRIDGGQVHKSEMHMVILKSDDCLLSETSDTV